MKLIPINTNNNAVDHKKKKNQVPDLNFIIIIIHPFILYYTQI